MKLRLICVGRVKESFTKEWLEEYSKRLGRDTPTVAEIKESSPAQEAKEIIAKIGDEFCVVLDSRGKTMTSLEFAVLLKRLLMQKNMAFVIGGPEGVTDDVRLRADLLLSMGPLTFSHQVCRVMLMEQLYRAFSINQHKPYHK